MRRGTMTTWVDDPKPSGADPRLDAWTTWWRRPTRTCRNPLPAQSPPAGNGFRHVRVGRRHHVVHASRRGSAPLGFGSSTHVVMVPRRIEAQPKPSGGHDWMKATATSNTATRLRDQSRYRFVIVGCWPTCNGGVYGTSGTSRENNRPPGRGHESRQCPDVQRMGIETSPDRCWTVKPVWPKWRSGGVPGSPRRPRPPCISGGSL